MFPAAERSAFGREKILLTSEIEFFPEQRIMPSALGAKAVAIAHIGSSGAYFMFSIRNLFPDFFAVECLSSVWTY